MKCALVALSALALSGCTTVHFDDQGRLESVHFYGRGCVDAIIGPKAGLVWVTVQQDGTTDWVIGRAAGSVVRELVAGISTALGAPGDVLRSFFGIPPPPPPPPSDVHGCTGVLELIATPPVEESPEAEKSPTVLERLRDLLE